MGLFKRKCGHTSATPFRVRCTRDAGHSGLHWARGLQWDADGRIKFRGGQSRKSSRR
jgi:hypothetical protein